MKKLIDILICILYLASSVGYASIEHYCHAAHEQSSVGGDCCCALACGASVAVTADLLSHCCASDTPLGTSDKSALRLKAGQCCENISRFSQIDEPTTRESNSIEASPIDGPTTLLSMNVVKWNAFPQALDNPTDPSFQLNLPLLN